MLQMLQPQMLKYSCLRSSIQESRNILPQLRLHHRKKRQPATLADQIERIGRALAAKELAQILSVSKITIFKQAKTGRIPSFRIGTCVRFDPRAVANWLRAQ